MISLKIYDGLTLLYLAVVFGSVISFALGVWKDIRTGYAADWETWLLKKENRNIVRAELLILLPILFVGGFAIALIGFPAYGAGTLIETIRKKRKSRRAKE